MPDSNTPNSNTRWTVDKMVAILAAGAGIVALLSFFGIKVQVTLPPDWRPPPATALIPDLPPNGTGWCRIGKWTTVGWSDIYLDIDKGTPAPKSLEKTMTKEAIYVFKDLSSS